MTCPNPRSCPWLRCGIRTAYDTTKSKFHSHQLLQSAKLYRNIRDGLNGQEARSLRRQRTPKRGHAVQMFRRVLELSIPAVVILNRVDGQRLKPAPSEREDQRVPRLEDTALPSVFLDPSLSSRTVSSAFHQTFNRRHVPGRIRCFLHRTEEHRR